jgi:uncharacterized protein (TIRG00374 family)
MKQNLSFIIKLLITVVLTIYVLSRIDLRQVIAVLAAMDPYYVLAGIGFGVLSIFFIATRWAIILRIFYPELRSMYLIGCYWIGIFFSLFLPSSLSGDIVRIYKINKKHGGLHKIITTGVIDRAIGLFTLIALGTIIIVFNRSTLRIPDLYLYSVELFWTGILIAVLAIWLLLNNNSILVKLNRINISRGIIKWLKECLDLAHDHPRVIYGALLLSFISLLIFFAGIFCFARAVGITISTPQLFLITSLVSLAVSIPISINGLGVQDGAYILFLGQVGVPASYALSLSLLVHLSKYLIYSVGGLFYLLDND